MPNCANAIQASAPSSKKFRPCSVHFTKLKTNSGVVGDGCSVEIVIRSELVYEQTMTAAKALDRQIELYRRMTGEQRLSIALNLHEMSCEIAREGIRHQNPKANAAEVESLLRRRLELARGA